jgi:hypothetical protein
MVASRNPAVPGKAFELSLEVAEREAIGPAVAYRPLTIEILTVGLTGVIRELKK